MSSLLKLAIHTVNRKNRKMDMILEEPRKQPPQGQQWYAVDVSFIRKGTFEVMAENEEQAAKLVREKCGVHPSDIVSDLPSDNVAWCFHVVAKMEIGEVKRVDD